MKYKPLLWQKFFLSDVTENGGGGASVNRQLGHTPDRSK